MDRKSCIYELSVNIDHYTNKNININNLNKNNYFKNLNARIESIDVGERNKYLILSMYMFGTTMRFISDELHAFTNGFFDEDNGFFDSSYFNKILDCYSTHIGPNEKISRELLVLATVISYVIAGLFDKKTNGVRSTMLDLDIEELKNYDFEHETLDYVQKYLYDVIPLDNFQRIHVLNSMNEILGVSLNQELN